ncbi:MAG: alkyl hydroperoxide reductase subunit F [Candidatus Symbiothrix sp.]|jgi:alkyl hydroperoxide reductase subunit F|nr:alkyl hydroperoxide reductase subunit F [Candidatus Symbiothrix sp.]
MLEQTLKDQLKTIFADLSAEYLLDARMHANHDNRTEVIALLNDVAASSDKISVQVNDGENLSIYVSKNGQRQAFSFRGLPTGHEFTSLLLAILNSDGKGKNIPDETICRRVKALGAAKLTTYVSLTCTNCPNVVQNLNLMSILNPNITHEMVDGALFQDEANALNIQAVPSVFADGQLLHVGKADFGELLSALEARYQVDQPAETITHHCDTVVVGGGPAGSAAAIYLSRKGLKVAVVAERIGGQVKETVGIENLISVTHTTGEKLAADLRRHLQAASVEIMEHRRVEKIDLMEDGAKLVATENGEQFIAPIVIVATGASWRKLNVPGESDYIGRGVAFCPHCDGPFYTNKHVAVVGGGNSGIEAAIDLAGICSKVTVFEFMDELKADKVLQDKVHSLPNVEIFVSSQTTEVIGNGAKVTALRVKDRKTTTDRIVALDGVFVQIGLLPNSSIVKDIVATNRQGEIEIDAHCRTSQAGIYAAGDVTTVPYKQIIISMGEGAKAALSAFDDRIRH